MCVSAEVTHSFKLRLTLWQFMFGDATKGMSVLKHDPRLLSHHAVPDLHNRRAACGTRELSQLQNMLQQTDVGYIIDCLSRISFKLQQN